MTVVVHEEPPPRAVVPQDPTGPDAILQLIRLALDKGVPVESLERLQALHERISDRQAAAEFARALAGFQSACPPIAKNAKADIITKSGTKFSYAYAPLDHIAEAIAPLLREHQLVYTWDSEVVEKRVRCTCILRHVNGHQVTARFECPVESNSAASEQQKYAAALSYARRQSLIQVLGLTTCDPDTDGVNQTPVTEDQAIALQDLITERGVNLERFLQWAGVSSLAKIPQANYGACIRAIDSYAQHKAKRGAP